MNREKLAEFKDDKTFMGGPAKEALAKAAELEAEINGSLI